MKFWILACVLPCTACGYVPGSQQNLERRASAILADSLFDAESARYRNLVTASYPGGKGAEPIICGEVNAKNKLGAYTGFTRFIVSEESRFIAVDHEFDLSRNAETDLEIKEAATQEAFNGSWPPCEGKSLPKPTATQSDEVYAQHLGQQADRLEELANKTDGAAHR